MRLIAALNRRYDNVPEPWRILLALALFLPGIFVAANIVLFREWSLVGAVWLIALFFVRAAWKAKWVR